MSDDGTVSAVMLALLTLVALLCLATADAANVLMSRARAQAAADAAALGAAAAQWPVGDDDRDPQAAARELAERNGATLERCDCARRGRYAAVRVYQTTRVRMLGVAPPRVHATARAEVDLARVFMPRAEGG